MNRKDRSAFDALNLVPEHFICLKADRAYMSGVSLRSTLLAFHFVRCCSLSLSSLTKLKHDVLFIKFIRCLKVNDAEWICLSFCRSLRHYFPAIGGSKKKTFCESPSHSALQRSRGGWAVPRVAVILGACTPTQRYFLAYKLSHAGKLGNALRRSWQCPDHLALMFFYCS